MSTRLDRLFLLLENGTTPVIRKSAAEQLGQVQKLHPHELYNLLDKVHTYLCSSNWDTRIAAAQAVEAIAKHVPKWDPKPIKLEGDAEAKEDHSASSAHLLSFQNFQISTVLAKATSLLASEGNEYDVHEDAIGGTPEERVALQKQRLNKRLGLDIAAQVGAIQVDQLFKEEDLVIKHEPTASTAQQHQQAPVSELVKQHLHMLQSQQRAGTGRSSPQGGAAMSTAACADPTLSARERNRAKRKAKLLSRQVSQDVSTAGDGSDGSESPVIKHRRISADTPHIADASAAVSVWDGNELTGWPFATFCGQLTSDLFNSSWEHRHGAATGLREILRLHGAGAGRLRCYDKQQILDSNQRWLEDTAIRLICVLALDRFGDFVADEVVAPVRETCAQTLGTVAHHMSAERTTACLRVILQLTEQKQWEVRHGGLLALKYVLAVKTDLTRELLPLVLPSLFVGLQDLDDDVRSVAAAALIPVTNALTQHYTDKVPEILQCLWLTLGDLDDLTSSTASILTLLADFLSKPHVLHQRLLGNLSLTNLVPLLFPFFRHANTSVRKSSMLTLKALTSQQHNAQSDGSSSTATWILPILLDTVRHVYQRVLMESKPELIPVIEETWTSVISCVPVEELASTVIPWLGVCLCLIMQAPHLPYDPQMIITAKHQPKELTPSRIRYAQHTSEQQLANNNIQVSSSNMNRKEYLGGHDTVSEPPHVRDRLVNRACLMGCRLAGLLYHQLTVSSQHSSTVESSIGAIVHTLSFYLASKSANQRIHVANSVAEWALVAQPKDCGCPDTMKEALVRALEENIYYEEITSIFGRMQTECRDFVAGLKLINADVDPSLVNIVYNIDQAQHLCTDAYNKIRANLKNKQLQLYDERRKALQDTVTTAANMQHTHTIRVQSSLAGALINLHHLPPKLNPVIRPLMESLKTEDNPQLQNRSALSLARLLLLIQHREPCPNPKVIRNITTMLCCDTSMTPSIADTPVVGGTGQEDDDDSNSSTHAPLSDQLPKCDRHTGIVSLAKVTKVAPIRPGRRVVNKKPSQYIDDSDVISSADGDRDKDKHQHSLQRRGAAYALTNMVRLCGDGLRTKLPALWDMLTASMCKYRDVATAGDTHEADNVSAAQDVVNVLQVLEVVAPVLTSECRNQLSGHISLLCGYVQSWFSAVRHLSARCIAALVAYDVGRGMGVVFDTVLPLIHPTKPTQTRQGAMETLYLLIVELGVCIVPYIVLLLVPVLGLLSDRDASVRLLANQCFASLVKLAPLDSELDSDDLKDMSAELISRRVAERQFLDQLMDVSKLQNYHIPVTINATLRSYQQSGVDWLHFLCRYKLHGILCDDMGLGKTLQSLCVVAGIHHDIINSGDPCTTEPPRSLVVCPPTLTGHWVAEVEQFLPPDQLTPLHYAGNPQDRQRLQRHVAKHDVVIASYDSVRADIAFFSKLQWTYCILDEGHIIKNSKTKLSQAVKQLSCTHRLILSGTPIQNNVLELWSLFDFLMPGYLGTEKQFQARYGRPILQSRDAKSSSKEQEAGALAMESLHRQVLPFLLRRKKEDVLKDLPPKIIQDYYCDLSPIQVELYEDFARSRAKQEAEECISGEKVKKPVHHVFQALQYLRKVCNHPALVLNPQHPQYTAVQQRLRAENTTISHLQHAAKLTALRQLLLDCGIGGDSSEDNVVNQHRVLLFCQLKSMLDIIEKDLLKTHLPNVTYLRLDGSVPPIDRHGLVTRFNSDPSIDLLLLTTHVGGLGLNLTGADTVIFYDHDWNPMKDLQAMDRAHRIGQKRVVTVYRLVTRGTLEEKIMGLQRFKLHLANTVISDDNSSLAQMGTNQLLDLFTISASDRQHQTYSEKETGIGAGGSVDMSVGGVGSSLGGVGGKGEAKEVLSALGELWDEKQYENEYDLTEFIKHLHA